MEMYGSTQTSHGPTGIQRDMSWLSFVPGKTTLVLLFHAAQQRLSGQILNVAGLSDARLASATEELNQIADDVRDAKDAHDAEASDRIYVSPPVAPLRHPGNHSELWEVRQSKRK